MRTFTIAILALLVATHLLCADAIQRDAIYAPPDSSVPKMKQDLKKLHKKDFKVLKLQPGEKVSQAKCIKRVPPKPPKELFDKLQKRERISLHVIIDSRGKVVSVAVKSGADSIFKDSAIKALWSWTFAPAKHKDTPVMSQIVVPFIFAKE